MRYVVANIGTSEPIIRVCDSFEDAVRAHLELLSYGTGVILTREIRCQFTQRRLTAS